MKNRELARSSRRVFLMFIVALFFSPTFSFAAEDAPDITSDVGALMDLQRQIGNIVIKKTQKVLKRERGPISGKKRKYVKFKEFSRICADKVKSRMRKKYEGETDYFCDTRSLSLEDTFWELVALGWATVEYLKNGVILFKKTPEGRGVYSEEVAPLENDLKESQEEKKNTFKDYIKRPGKEARRVFFEWKDKVRDKVEMFRKAKAVYRGEIFTKHPYPRKAGLPSSTPRDFFIYEGSKIIERSYIFRYVENAAGWILMPFASAFDMTPLDALALLKQRPGEAITRAFMVKSALDPGFESLYVKHLEKVFKPVVEVAERIKKMFERSKEGYYDALVKVRDTKKLIEEIKKAIEKAVKEEEEEVRDQLEKELDEKLEELDRLLSEMEKSKKGFISSLTEIGKPIKEALEEVKRRTEEEEEMERAAAQQRTAEPRPGLYERIKERLRGRKPRKEEPVEPETKAEPEEPTEEATSEAAEPVEEAEATEGEEPTEVEEEPGETEEPAESSTEAPEPEGEG